LFTHVVIQAADAVGALQNYGNYGDASAS